ncbi:hypothetical protein SSAG_03334 [Streptomyces sp. Mg1]|nr:hypothetical protein SSAG_03334 [Streptomyces sp. Mg1]
MRPMPEIVVGGRAHSGGPGAWLVCVGPSVSPAEGPGDRPTFGYRTQHRKDSRRRESCRERRLRPDSARDAWPP